LGGDDGVIAHHQRVIGDLVYPLAARFVADALVVSDDAIIAAQHWLWRHLRLVAEPGGATAFAALLSGAYRPRKGERIGVLVCGGNADLATLL